MPTQGLPYRQKIEDNSGISRMAQPGDGPILNLSPTALTTAGAGTILAILLATGLIVRTGPAGAVADTIDTGANLDIAFPNMQIGDSIALWYIVSVGFAITITAATGVTLGSAAANNVIAANTGRMLVLRKTAVATYILYVI